MIRNRIKKEIKRLKAAPLPHLSAALSLCLAAALAYLAWVSWGRTHPLAFFLLSLSVVFWAVVAVISRADALSRHREYERIKSMLLKYGFHERIFAPVAGSRCQRDAALLAARETGCRERAGAFFRSIGYRWYHVVPDGIMLNPLNILRPSFLRTAFFAA